VSTYSYVVLDERGREIKGVIDAQDEKEAVKILRSKSWFVIELASGAKQNVETVTGHWLSLIGALNPKRYRKVKPMNLVLVFRQMALMLRAGQTVVESLESSALICSHHYKLNRALNSMCDDIRGGKTLSQAVESQNKIFSNYIVRLLESGESSGQLDTVLERLATDIERKVDTQRHFITAMTYPAIVVLIAIGVIYFMVFDVVPKFGRFLEGRGAELPDITLALLGTVHHFQDYGPYYLALFGGVVMSLLVATTQPKGKYFVDKMFLKTPIIGSAMQCASMAQVGWTFMMLVKSGLTVLDALRITSEVMSNSVYKKAFQVAGERLLQGQNLANSLDQKELPMMLKHLASIGERSGELDQVMNEVGSFYQKELNVLIKRLTAFIEPVLLLVVGGTVGFVYMAFFSAVMAVSNGGR
jgi:type II secretory pathway component PulF